MPAHLSITIDAGVYARLKKEVRPKRISLFIEEAVRAKLGPNRRTLDAAYKTAAAEPWRRELTDEWSATEGETWPT